MTHPTRSSFGGSNPDWGSLALAALMLVIVLIVCYMCIQVFKAHRTPNAAKMASLQASLQTSPREKFSKIKYRVALAGPTTGKMPSIERRAGVSWTPCCGSLGVPPPVYQ